MSQLFSGKDTNYVVMGSSDVNDLFAFWARAKILKVYGENNIILSRERDVELSVVSFQRADLA